MSQECEKCGRSYGKRKRCYYCQPGRRRSGIETGCRQCGIVFYAPKWKLETGQGKFCSYACHYESMRGIEKSRGTRYLRPDGYILIKTGIRQTAMEHRLVMEQVLGRRLTRDEEVHHVNGVRDDNRPENLVVMTREDHARLTNSVNTARFRSEKAELAELRIQVAEYERRYGPLESTGT